MEAARLIKESGAAPLSATAKFHGLAPNDFDKATQWQMKLKADTAAGDVATNCAELPGHGALAVMRTAAAADASWRRSSSEAD